MNKLWMKNLIIMVTLFTFVAVFSINTEAAGLNKKKITINVKESYQLKVTGTKKKIKWSSSNKKIASVTSKGKVKGKKAGQAIITAKYGKKKLTCELRVRIPMEYYAHRGYKGQYPENTKVAFNGAMKAGFSGIEFDIFETNSGDIMVFHDDTMERLTGKTGSISDVSVKNRKDYLIINGENISKYGPQLIPTFEETVKSMKKKKAFLYVHLKGVNNYTKEGIDKIYKILQKYDMVDQSIIFCGNISLISKFKAKGMQVGVNMTTTSKKAIMDHINDCINSNIKTFIVFYPDKVNQKIVDKCHENGIRLGVYSVQNKKDAARLNQLGVDFVFSNNVLF